MIRLRVDQSGWQRGQPERHVAGRRPPSPEEHERQRLAHEQEMEAHQPNSGGLDWLTTMQKKESEKSQAAATDDAVPGEGMIEEFPWLKKVEKRHSQMCRHPRN